MGAPVRQAGVRYATFHHPRLGITKADIRLIARDFVLEVIEDARTCNLLTCNFAEGKNTMNKERYINKLNKIKESGNYRMLRDVQHNGFLIHYNEREMLNLSSYD